MDIFFSNTLSRTKELFKPLVFRQVGMYHCGPTVYDYPHIGNLRSYVLADTLKRLFLTRGFQVKQVINITDVGHLVSDSDDGEDKMEKSASREGKSAEEIARFYEQAFFDDLRLLNINTEETIFPRATEHIKEQVELIKELEKEGIAYVISDGVYFDTSRFSAYGKALGVDISGLSEGARVLKNSEKKNATDFALWKFSKEGEKRQQEWESPWGVGFPGWHIECSAMSMKYLGKQFDIHTGGIDHIQVHHTNEIAQSEAATGKSPFVRYWLHNGFLTVDGKKMAKSEGNFYRLIDIEKKGISPLGYRYWLLTGHYARQLNFTWDAVFGAEEAYKKIRNAFLDLGEKNGNLNKHYQEKFDAYLGDDLGTPQAVALLWELLKDSSVSPEDKRATLIYFDSVLGLGLLTLLKETIPENVLLIVSERGLARKEKRWSDADLLRAKILALGYDVSDGKDGEIIRKL